MRVHQIFTGSHLRNFSYVIHSDDGQRVFCIDPCDADQIADFLNARGLRLTHIINTHEHADHTSGNAGLVDRYKNVWVCAHERAQSAVPGFNQPLRVADQLEIEPGAAFEVLDTPGHSRAHVYLLLKTGAAGAHGVFTGDILFNAGVSRCDRGGDPDLLYETIRDQFQTMADDLAVYPGHEYMGNNLKFTLEYEPENAAARRLLREYHSEIARGRYIVSTLGLERAMNTFLRLDSPELRRELSRRFADLDSDADDRAIFLRLRQLRDDW